MAIQQTPALFKPIKVGRMTLQHRVVHAPLTRLRTYASHVPGPQLASYYAQRASIPGTLLIAEGTIISHDAGGFPHVPGIYTDEQIEAWKKVADAVHANGSYVYLQLAAMGRSADIDFLEKQDPPAPYVGVSDVASPGKPRAPRPLTETEIQAYVSAFAKAASNAVHRAGFDGVEIHAANGYFLDQFLSTMSNKRTDGYGGDEQGRTRVVREVVDAMVDAVGEDRVAIRISPWSNFQGVKMPDPRPTFGYLVAALRDKHPRLAFLDVIEPRVAGDGEQSYSADEDNDFLREIWKSEKGGEERAFISAGGHTRETALRAAERSGDLIAFGRLYISNPDLPLRLQNDLALTPPDRSKYYLAGNLTPFGYSDWLFANGSLRATESSDVV